jgi:hypothetical protein
MTSDYNIFTDRLNNVDDSPSNVLSLSQWQSSTGLDLHSMVAASFNQIFVDESSKDFHLIVNSQALDVGTNLVALGVTEDYEGNPRPSGGLFDIGAYEKPDSDCTHSLLTVYDPITQGTYSSALQIESNATINQNVQFKASQSVELKPSFTVPLTFTFSADVLPCSQH